VIFNEFENGIFSKFIDHLLSLFDNTITNIFETYNLTYDYSINVLALYLPKLVNESKTVKPKSSSRS
jgi:hypothetical protein